MQYLLAIDQGTTGSTALLMDKNLNAVAEASEDFTQRFPQPGWVEHDLNDIWSSVLTTVKNVTQGVDPKKIAAIGITNQRETLCFWERSTGSPLAPAIVWQDRRTATHCESLRARGLEPLFQEKTGLLLDPYFSGTKLAWALQNWSDLTRAHQAKKLCVGTIDSYLIARLSGGLAHVTEPSNASRTLLFNLRSKSWDPELCQILNVPLEILPEVKPSAGLFAKTKGLSVLPDDIPITGVLGDQQAALMGQACLAEGQAKCTYGTGAFLLMNSGSKPVTSKHRLLTTIAWDLGKQGTTYALEGSAFIAGAAVQWLRDGLKLIKSASEIESLALSVPSTDGVVFVPALTGLGAPYWNPHATGMFTGITRGTTAGHFARAVLEGIAFQNADLLSAMQKDLGKPLALLKVDGGASANNLLMQFQADVLATPLMRPRFLETTSLGALFAAGLGGGVFTTLDQVEKTWKLEREFKPTMDQTTRLNALKGWKTAVTRAMIPSA